MRDTLFKDAQNVQPFSFNDAVVQVFPDMIQRSVPAYQSMLELIVSLSSLYLRPNSRCYDLGCSLGAVSALLSQRLEADNSEIIAIDNSQAMIEQLKERLSAFEHLQIPITTQLADITEVSFQPCSLVILNLTLQFIAPEKRGALIQSIYNALDEGGALIICDKVIYSADEENQNQIKWHEQFKRMQGYGEMEISQKRAAIMNVLQPDSPEEQIQRLSEIGFSTASQWFQAFNFCGYIGVK